jgi:hypothetical protein
VNIYISIFVSSPVPDHVTLVISPGSPPHVDVYLFYIFLHGYIHTLVLPKPVYIWVSPVDSIPLDSDSSPLIRLSLRRWDFPSSVRYLQIYQKYKGQGVPFPPDFRSMLSRYRDPTVGVSLGSRGYRTSRSVKRHGSQKQGIPPVPGDVTRPSPLPQENQDVLKKVREMKLGGHIDHAHSISLVRLGEKYYLMILIDGIDFVWTQTCQVRTNPEDLLHDVPKAFLFFLSFFFLQKKNFPL